MPGNTHCDFQLGDRWPIKIKPATILASVQSREAQWTQAPDTDTDTLPRISGHGPVLSTPKAPVVSRVLCWFHHRHQHLALTALSFSTAASEGHDRLSATFIDLGRYSLKFVPNIKEMSKLEGFLLM